ncbi:hypothetical protein OA19_21620, partial [Vibrio vulnificus]|uniref:hypothetical protein n=1 Tax=Vibrio vulnificus TaxID=672 RepID=UPI0005423E71
TGAQTLKLRRFIRLTNALSFNEATLRIFRAHELESRKQRPLNVTCRQDQNQKAEKAKKRCNQLILRD